MSYFEAPRNARAYLSGPMRGYRDGNREAFEVAATNLRKLRGYEVFSPPEVTEELLTRVAFHSFADQLRFTLKLDMDWICDYADLIVVLYGWEHSLGARAEVALAHAVGIPVCTIDIALAREYPIPSAHLITSTVTPRAAESAAKEAMRQGFDPKFESDRDESPRAVYPYSPTGE